MLKTLWLVLTGKIPVFAPLLILSLLVAWAIVSWLGLLTVTIVLIVGQVSLLSCALVPILVVGLLVLVLMGKRLWSLLGANTQDRRDYRAGLSKSDYLSYNSIRKEEALQIVVDTIRGWDGQHD